MKEMETYIFTSVDEFKEAKKYWLEKLSGELNELKLPGDFPRTKQYTESTCKAVFEKEKTGELIRISKNNDLSLFIILLVSFKIMLFKYLDQNDIIVAAPVYSTGSRKYNKYVVFRDSVHSRLTFRELLVEVKDTVVEGYKNEYYSGKHLMEHLELREGMSLCRVVLLLEDIHERKFINDIRNDYENDIVVSARKRDGGLEMEAIYNSLVFKKETIRKLLEVYKHVLTQVISNANIRVSDVELITEEEKNNVLFEFNNTNRDYPGDKTIPQLFADQVKKVPDRIAAGSIVDLDDIYDELKNETIGSHLFEKLETCCFNKNPYVFISDMETPDGEKPLKILKTHRHTSVIVNNNVAALLNCFDGERNTWQIFSQLKNRNLKMYVYPVRIEDLLEISCTFAAGVEEFSAGRFEEFVGLLKLLYRNYLIELTGISPVRSVEKSFAGDFAENETFAEKVVIDDLYNRGGRLSKGDVLLVGDTPGMPTVGLLYMASYLYRNGIRAYCHFHDLNGDYVSLKKNIEYLLDRIEPKIVGVSMKWFPYMARVLEICKIVKAHSPGTRVVVGANTASYYWKEVIGYDFVDYVIRGDGEVPLLKLCQGADEVPNCIYKKKGKIIENPITYVHDETNSKEVYLSHLDKILISRYASIFGTFFIPTQKGCTINCCYCGGCKDAQLKTFARKGIFRRGIEEVRKDIIEAKKYASLFMFDLIASNEYYVDYFKKITHGIDLSSHFCVYGNYIAPSAEIIDLMSKTFKYVYWELDMASLSRGHRDRLVSMAMVKIQPSDKDIIDFYEACEKYDNGEVRMNLIAGLPYFNKEDVEASDNMLNHIIKSYSCFSDFHWGRLHAQPGAPIVESAREHDMYSYAATYEDFLKYSEMNFDRESPFPGVEDYNYPYVYFNDDELNTVISKHSVDTRNIIREYKRKRREALLVNETLTYRQLNQRADRLAGKLREYGVQGGSIVGLMLQNSLEMVVGILGILKAGAAYLPIGPDYPRERIDYILKDSGAKVLVSELSEVRGLSEGPIRRTHLTYSTHPCYIIYTSGTTGNPKGVIVEHRGIVNYIHWRINAYRYREDDVTLQLLPHIFDGFASNFYSSLFSGGTLLMIPDSRRLDFDYIKKAIKYNRVTNTSVVPGIYEALLDSAVDGDMDSLRFVVLGGEEARANLIKKIKEKQPGVRLINEYGPTEASVTAAACLEMDEKNCGIIGKPISNTCIYILDSSLKPCAVDVPGELYIAGDGVARGYLNQPELTAERFILVSYKSYRTYRTYSSKKIYKTGDLARWQPDGNIQYLGRKDFQVKIRGSRVELGEIENRLLEHSDVKDAAVLAQEDHSGENYLCAYIVSDTALIVSKLKEYLAAGLPDYMIPLYFVQIEKIPVTPSGKVDRKALPSPGSGVGGEDYQAPRDGVEKELVEIWSEVLGKETGIIGIDTNFFQLGGHSLKAARMVSLMHKVFNVKVSLEETFKRSTVRGLADYIKKAVADRFVFIEPAEEMGCYALSPAQKRLYILQQLNPESTGYNMFQTVELEGEFESGKLEQAFLKMIRRHDSLRTSFKLIGEVPVQEIHRHTDLEFKIGCYRGGSSSEVEKIAAGFMRPFDLSRVPLLRVGLIRTGENKGILMFDMHHIISDGVSMVIFVNEFGTLYSGKELSPLRLQYKDFSEWQNRGMGGKDMKRQELYWLKKFSREVPPLSLPVDYERPSLQRFVGDRIDFSLGKEETAAVNELAARHEATQFMVILAVYNVLLAKLGGQEDIVVGTSTAGRNHADLERIIGIFFNTLALRNYPQNDKTFVDFLKEVKGNTLDAFENQDYQFDDLVENVAPDRDAGRNPIYNVKLVLLNVDTRDLEIPGLRLKLVDFENKTTKLDLGLSGAEVGGELLFTFEYSTDLFRRETIEEFIEYFKNIVSSVLDDPGQRLYEVGRITGVKREKILSQFTDRLENE